MTQQDTQPPAETLGPLWRKVQQVQNDAMRDDVTPDEYRSRMIAALTRRAGSDAVPAGMKPWHGGDAAPADWDGGSVFRQDGNMEDGDTITRQQWEWMFPVCKWNIIAYTPKPPAGGDAGAVDMAVVSDAISYAKMILAAVFEKRERLRDGVLASNINIAAHRLADALAVLALPAPVVEGDDLAWFGSDTRLSLEHYSPVYGDDDDQSREWRVHRESGSINDRIWDIVGRGSTPHEAIAAARAALSEDRSHG